ncbi:hypothetical protein OG562_45595 [Streptomyces sp. NBC_01275]|uniref:hypothetical protein n=1 Tax=Streptomyces sp. NBC_01275 TaxID=2903807 RepID=UPI00224D9B7A|nr:hypothetical protein [Streptomyces sp. NBC_01275]MCX4768070.1 hypothetical protein [Streptomyces sp. NBC_01275]
MGCRVSQPLLAGFVGVGPEGGERFDGEVVVAFRPPGENAIADLLAQCVGVLGVVGHAAQPCQHKAADRLAHAGVAVVLSQVTVGAVGQGDYRCECEGVRDGAGDVAQVGKAQQGLESAMIVGCQVVPHVFDRALGVAEGEERFYRDLGPPLPLVLAELLEFAARFAPGGRLVPGQQLRLAGGPDRAAGPAGCFGLGQGFPAGGEEQAAQGEVSHQVGGELVACGEGGVGRCAQHCVGPQSR